jgi:hypothetical protein
MNFQPYSDISTHLSLSPHNVWHSTIAVLLLKKYCDGVVGTKRLRDIAICECYFSPWYSLDHLQKLPVYGASIEHDDILHKTQ